MMSVPMVAIASLNRTHESNELAGNNPVEITVFHTLIVLVLLHIEGLEVVPTKLDCALKALQAMEKRAIVETAAL